MFKDAANSRLPNLHIHARIPPNAKKEIRLEPVTCISTAPLQSQVIWKWKDGCLGEDKPIKLGLYDGFSGLFSGFPKGGR